jgi:hypothetical protein
MSDLTRWPDDDEKEDGKVRMTKNERDEMELDIKYLSARVKELEQRQKWIDEVTRPTHPDDERPWCAAYLDCRARIKELEEGIEQHRDIIGESASVADLKLYKLVKEKP